ncbi:hypothetical protein CC78DRAFT_68523 [Lojkania enalia]|uniref:Uncharacterized protein n=1 Tax=Lojkania enalia TaxID=147567 RepID=A0A9P4K4R7_9PLEO|nr:hypothetical protein CC78DRAFT_68523 [Didymosphaeria enalia]
MACLAFRRSVAYNCPCVCVFFPSLIHHHTIFLCEQWAAVISGRACFCLSNFFFFPFFFFFSLSLFFFFLFLSSRYPAFPFVVPAGSSLSTYSSLHVCVCLCVGYLSCLSVATLACFLLSDRWLAG